MPAMVLTKREPGVIGDLARWSTNGFSVPVSGAMQFEQWLSPYEGNPHLGQSFGSISSSSIGYRTSYPFLPTPMSRWR